jgi:nickel/cobalt transporter (NicO) family protein
MSSKIRSVLYFALFICSALLIWTISALPSLAHWSDMSAAEILLDQTTAQMNLTYPTGLTPFADDDRNGQLSDREILAHQHELTEFLGQAIRFTNGTQAGALTVRPLAAGAVSPVTQAAPSSHSTLQMTYTWPQPLQALKIHYSLFLPNVSTASCLATILQNQQLKTFVFTPRQQVFATAPGLDRLGNGGLLLAIGGAMVWGAMHSLSPGHGKTLVGAYLVGSRATPQHAIFLALITTVTHTLGIFALGLITLFASRYILPEQLYPWMNLVSGGMVAVIGGNLFWSRFKQFSAQKARHAHSHHSHDKHIHNGHTHSHEPQLALQTVQAYGFAQVEPLTQHHSRDHHDHEHHHEHHRGHSHLPPDADGAPITWCSLLALGISGGLVPCPAALVLLLSCIALGNVGLGLGLVLAFSLGLAAVLTGLGLLMVYAKPLFRHLPVPNRTARFLPALSALGIVVIGVGLSAQAALQIVGR